MTARPIDITANKNLIALFPGRSIAFSPEWRDEGLSVLFDRNSGDYWVVSALARKIVEEVAVEAGWSADELAHPVLGPLSPEEKTEVGVTTAHEVLDELVRLEILVRSGLDPASVEAGR